MQTISWRNQHKLLLAAVLWLPALLTHENVYAVDMPVRADEGLAIPVFDARYSHLQALDDEALSETNGQALFNLSYIAPADPGNAGDYNNGKGFQLNQSGVGFYRLGVEGVLEANLNVRNLQLGCGGANNVIAGAACDIDIKNFALSGAPDGVQAGTNSGSPAFNAIKRPGTSAVLTNPFIELAFKNPDNPATREFIGFRVSAESIVGMLSTGLENGIIPSTSDGIQRLSGYLKVAATTGDVNTAATTFGKGVACVPLSSTPGCQSIGGHVQTLLGARYFRSLPTDAQTTGITVPSLNTGFSLPAFTVNGTRVTQAVVDNVSASLPWLPIAAPGDCPGAYAAECAAANAQIAGVNYNNDQLYLLLTEHGNRTTWPGDCLRILVCLVENAKFKMGPGSAITNLNLNITFKQQLSMFHNIPLNGTGFYLSAQQQAIHWPGANPDDIAQRGWWMSFAEPVQLGYLQAQQPVDISALLPQVAATVTRRLLADPAIDVSGLGDTVTALGNNPLVKTIVINAGESVASLVLENQQLRSQHVVPNCWGSLQFC